jgi:hypothetical protein
MSSVEAAALAALRARKAAATDARTVAEAELAAILDQLANVDETNDAAETTRLNNRKAEVQARLDAQAEIEADATAILEKAELSDAGIVKEPVSVRRATFDAMTPAQQFAHAKAGGIVVDPPKIVKSPAPVPAGGIRRSDFERLDPSAQFAHAMTGRPIVD